MGKPAGNAPRPGRLQGAAFQALCGRRKDASKRGLFFVLFLFLTWETAMAARRQPQQESAKAALIATLEHRLATHMGVRLTLFEKLVGTGAGALAMAWLVTYGVAAILILSWWNHGLTPQDGHAKLVSLIAWSVVHFTALISITRIVTPRALEIVRRDILPFASDDYASSVVTALSRRHASLSFRLVPYVVATLGMVAAIWSISGDIEPVWWNAREFPLDLLFWSATVFYTSLLSMWVVETAKFPREFAAAIEQDREAFYPPDAARSPLIQGLARLNRTILTYWGFVFLILATVMLLVLPPEPFGLNTHSPFLFTMFPILAFFSLGGGALIYLESEFLIANAVRRSSQERVSKLQGEIIALLNRSQDGDEESAARFERLTRLHDQTIAGGRYGSRFGTAFGVALPFVFPAIGLIEKLIHHGAPSGG
jgi:hypothetical protein